MPSLVSKTYNGTEDRRGSWKENHKRLVPCFFANTSVAEVVQPTAMKPKKKKRNKSPSRS